MIRKKSHQTAVISLLSLFALTNEAAALPMFTTQTGMDCTGCHTQHMPRLNKFGRKFVASGMTISQQVADMGKTFDTDINPSLVIKSKYAKTWDKPNGKGTIKEDDTNDGEFSLVRMATLYTGGRITENIGAMLNLGWRKEEKESISGKVTYAHPVEDGYWGVTAYSNASQGPFSGMEFYNTGLYKPLRTFDMRVYSNANQSTKIGAKGATGLQVYYDKDNFLSDRDHFFITAGIYTPTQDNALIEMNDNILPFARIAYEHPMGDYNVIVGAFVISGGDTVADTDILSIKRETYGIDLQVEGTIMDKEASLTLTNVFKNKVEFTGIGAQDTDDTEDIYNESFSVEGAVSVTSSIVAKVAYMTFDDHYIYKGDGEGGGGEHELKNDVKDLDYAITVGLDYAFTVKNKPMKLALEYAWMDPYLDRVKNYQSFMATLTLPF
ncbi:hypothetical protein [Sulfurovum mangrovi]|uniref:hypothetical protein n=1 Tax=Sulfurovum mangrovi TaxID=2893889 RepID=UPI001E518A19|nr:hypothetical protein [Sulfurovum mangrovi]UFH58173.1 hypothetical protein LN246_07390 [Sulfurovum mangrovi]